MSLRSFKSSLESTLLKEGAIKLTQKEAFEKEVCMVCGQPALAKCRTDAGRKEYFISATCENCFDRMFPED